MRKLDYPMAPAVLAIVLGPMAESSVRQALLMSNGSFMFFFQRPMSGTIMVIALVLIFLPLLKVMKNVILRRRQAAEPL